VAVLHHHAVNGLNGTTGQPGTPETTPPSSHQPTRTSHRFHQPKRTAKRPGALSRAGPSSSWRPNSWTTRRRSSGRSSRRWRCGCP